ncbi:MAG TPA: FUSC family protein [Solirubrobacterales bacterium]|nr:FUSC family protein [Solirubrobacterales bacterium]
MAQARATTGSHLPATWTLRGDPVPAIGRGFLVAVPVAAGLLTELELDDAVAGGVGSAAMICGFIAFDAPARVRVRWQLCCAPLVGMVAALGVLTSQTVATAILGMAVVATLGGYAVAVSLRMAIAGLSVVLVFLIAQGLWLEPAQAWTALAIGTCGGLAQAGWAACVWAVVDRGRERRFELRRAAADTAAKLRAGLDLHRATLRHAVRFGAALAIGVAIYRLVGFHDHGYWVPLTILFVLKPEASQTSERIAMRAAGTAMGLVLATAVAEVLSDAVIPTTIVLTIAAALAYALLAIEYALFTTAITVYVVLLTDTLGSSAFDAAGERALGTVLGILVAALAFRAFGEVGESHSDTEPERK